MKKLFLLQGLITLIFTLYFYFNMGKEAALSSALGGITCIVPGLLFILITFKGRDRNESGGLGRNEKAAKRIVSQFYLGETIKLFVTVVLFTVFLQWSKLKALPMFLTFIFTQMVFWLTPWILKDDAREGEGFSKMMKKTSKTSNASASKENASKLNRK